MDQLWLDQTWRHGTNPLKRFVKTHNGLMTVIGAAIVFATFVIKDAYRESLRESASAIAEAQQSYQLTSSTNQIFVSLDSIFAALDKMDTKIDDARLLQARSDKDPVKVAEAKIRSDEDQLKIAEKARVGMRELYQMYDTNLTSMCRLLKTLPPNLEREKNCTKMNLFASKLEQALADPNRTRDVVTASLKSDNPITRGQAGSFYGLSIALPLNALVSFTDKLQKEVMAEANSQQERQEIRVHRATIASYILYPLGLVVSLIGKLYGSGEGAQDNEGD